MFGGFHIIFAGDFFQLEPVKSGTPLYKERTALWDSINACVYLDLPWRFRDDPKWGKILERIRKGQGTSSDIDYINECVVGSNNIELPDATKHDVSYACPYNKNRNTLTDNIFKEHVLRHCPRVTDEDQPQYHTIVIESSMMKEKKRLNKDLRNYIYQHIGDDKCEVGNKKSRSVSKNL